MSEPRELHRAMLEHAKAGEHAEVVGIAEQYLDQFADSDDVELRQLTAGVLVTWLASKAHLAPAEALVACEEIFDRYKAAPDFEAPAVAAAALRVKSELLLQSGETQMAADVAGRLADFFEHLDDSIDLVQPGGQLIAAGERFLRSDQSLTATVLFRRVALRLADRSDPTSRQLAALARLWLLLAIVREGDPTPAIAEVESLDVSDDDAGQAIDLLLRELNGQRFWRWAIILLVGMKIDALDACGDHERARKTRRGFIEAFDGKWKDIPAVAVLVEKCRSDLASA